MAWAACFTALNEQSGLGGNGQQVCDNCHKSSAGGGPGGGSGSGSGTSSSSSSSGASTSSLGGSSSSSGSGTSSSSSSGSLSSSTAASGSSSGSGGSSGTVCDPGSYLATTTVSSFGAAGSGSPIVGATVSEIGRNGVQLPGAGTSVESDSNGTIQLCIPLDVPVTIEVTATGYPTTFLEEIDVTNDAGPSALLSRGLEMISSTELTAFGAFLQGGVPVNPSDAIVAAAVVSISQQAPCTPENGWTLGLAFLDGGTLPDGGALPFQIAYLGTTDIPSSTATITSSNGYSLIYDVDPSITNVAQLVATDVSGGSPCPAMNAEAMVTGRVSVQTGSVTFAPYFVP